MSKHASDADLAQGFKPKRSSRNGPPKCRVDNYGLARKQTLLKIVDRLYRQTYKVYKTEKTEWLVVDGELIGVQEKHKRDLGIVLHKFFEPCFNSAPERHPLLVAQGLEKQKVDILDSKISSFERNQPRLGYSKKRSLLALLSSDQVQLIDSQKLKQRLLNSAPQMFSFNNKVEKNKKFGSRTVIGMRKPSALEVLRASNRPKRTLKSQQKYNSRLSAIIHKQDNQVPPLNEDVLRFYERANYSTNKQKLDKSELEKKYVGKTAKDNVLKVWKYALKVRQSEAFSKEKNDMDTNGVCQKPKMSVAAPNIWLDKMNKKIPVGNADKKSLEDKVRASRAKNKAKQSGAKQRAEPTELGIRKVRKKHNEIENKAKQANMEMKTYEERLPTGEGNYLGVLHNSEVEDQQNPGVYAMSESKEIGKEIKINIVTKNSGNDEVIQAEEGKHCLEDFLYDSDVEDLIPENPEEYAIRDHKEMGKEIKINIVEKIYVNDEGLQAKKGRHYLEDFLYDSDVEDLIQANPEEYALRERKEIGKEVEINIVSKNSGNVEGLQAEEGKHGLEDFLYDSDVEDLIQANPEEYALRERKEKGKEIKINIVTKTSGNVEGLQAEEGKHCLEDFLYDSDVEDLIQANPEEYALRERKEKGKEIKINIVKKNSRNVEGLQAEEGKHGLEDFLYDSDVEDLIQANPEEYALRERKEKGKEIKINIVKKNSGNVEGIQAEEGKSCLEDFLYDSDLEDLIQANPEEYALRERKEIGKEIKINIVTKNSGNVEGLQAEEGKSCLEDFLYDSDLEDLIQANPEEYALRERKEKGKEIKINIVKKNSGNVEGIQAEEGKSCLEDFLYDSDLEDLIQANPEEYVLRERKEIGKEIKINIVKKNSGNVEGLQADEGKSCLEDFLYDSDLEDLIQANPEEYALRERKEKGKEIEINIVKKNSGNVEGLLAEEGKHCIDFLYDSDVEDLIQANPEEYALRERKEKIKETEINIVTKNFENDEGLQAEEGKHYLNEVLMQENPEECAIRECKEMGKEMKIKMEKKICGSDDTLVKVGRKDLQAEEGRCHLEDFLYDSEIEDIMEEKPWEYAMREHKEIGKEKKMIIEKKTSENDEGLQAEEGSHYLEDFLYDTEIENLMEENPEEYAKQLQEISEQMKSIKIASNMEPNQKSQEKIKINPAESEFNTPGEYESLMIINPLSMLKAQPVKPEEKTAAEEELAEISSCHSEVMRTAVGDGHKSTKSLSAELPHSREAYRKIFMEAYMDEAVHSRFASLRINQKPQFVIVSERSRVQFAIVQPRPSIGLRFEIQQSGLPWARFHPVKKMILLPHKRSTPCDIFLRIMLWFQALVIVSFLLFSVIP